MKALIQNLNGKKTPSEIGYCASETTKMFYSLAARAKRVQIIICRVVPCLALPCLALPCLALPCLAASCFTIPLFCLTLPCFAVPCRPSLIRPEGQQRR